MSGATVQWTISCGQRSVFPLSWMDQYCRPESFISSWSKCNGSYESINPMTKREQKRRPKPKDGTVLFCGVCGDRALGYNFDAISCESCKAFFRRNALKIKPFTCSFDGNCKLDPHTRKFCSGCRLKKCFAIGMKKEWILDAEQLQRRRQRQQSRYHQQQQQPSVIDIQPCSSTSGDQVYLDRSNSYSPGSLDTTCQSTFDNMSLNPSSSSPPSEPTSSSENFCPNSCHPQGTVLPPQSSYTHPKRLQSPNVTHSSPPLSNHTSQFQYDTDHFMPTEPAPPKVPKLHYGENGSSLPFPNQPQFSAQSLPTTHNDFDKFGLLLIKQEKEEEEKDAPIPLTPYLKDCIENLSKQYTDIFEEAYKQEQVPKMMNLESADQLFNMTEIFIRRLIRFARHLPEFKSLSQHDQIHLLKGGIMEMFVLRSAMSFDSNNASWKFQVTDKHDKSSGTKQGNINPSVLKLLGSDMLKNHMTFVLKLQQLAGKDKVVLMLLFIIDLLSPDRPNLQDKNIVLQGQERHCLWLKSYIESIHSISKAHLLYPQLLDQLLEVRNLGEASCQLVMHLDISKLEPLLLEVFDLNR